MATYQGVSNAPQDQLTDNSLAAIAAWQEREDGWLAALRNTRDSSAWLLNATVREALEASVAARICRKELWNLSSGEVYGTAFQMSTASFQLPSGCFFHTWKSRMRSVTGFPSGPVARSSAPLSV